MHKSITSSPTGIYVFVPATPSSYRFCYFTFIDGKLYVTLIFEIPLMMSFYLLLKIGKEGVILSFELLIVTCFSEIY